MNQKTQKTPQEASTALQWMIIKLVVFVMLEVLLYAGVLYMLDAFGVEFIHPTPVEILQIMVFGNILGFLAVYIYKSVSGPSSKKPKNQKAILEINEMLKMTEDMLSNIERDEEERKKNFSSLQKLIDEFENSAPDGMIRRIIMVQWAPVGEKPYNTLIPFDFTPDDTITPDEQLHIVATEFFQGMEADLELTQEMQSVIDHSDMYTLANLMKKEKQQGETNATI